MKASFVIKHELLIGSIWELRSSEHPRETETPCTPSLQKPTEGFARWILAWLCKMFLFPSVSSAPLLKDSGWKVLDSRALGGRSWTTELTSLVNWGRP